MATMIKIRCNGPNQHINEIDLDKVLQPTIVLRGWRQPKSKNIPERLVLRCQHCAEGHVVLTRKMIEAQINKSSE
jgi:hypothetical protein